MQIVSDPNPFADAIQQIEERLAIQSDGAPGPVFTQPMEGFYRLEYPDLGITLEIDRLRREAHSLVGELAVKCSIAGASLTNGHLSIADCNLSSLRARVERAKFLAVRSNAPAIDWVGIMEEFCQRVLAGERTGLKGYDLRTMPKPSADSVYYIDGLVLPKEHPSIIYGDGASAKSYIALYIAGELANAGHHVGVFDWELAGGDHRDRLECLYGPIAMPKMIYARCEKPLVYEIDGIRKLVREHQLEYAVLDSIAFACESRPEDAEVAGRYFRALRSLGIGTLNIAHISKGEYASDKPFGSVFWHNGARATYFVKKTDSEESADRIEVGLFQKKSNLGKLRKPFSFSIQFERERTWISKADITKNQELATRLPIKNRLQQILKTGSMSIADLADELEVPKDSIRTAAKRNKNLFVITENSVGLRNMHD